MESNACLQKDVAVWSFAVSAAQVPPPMINREICNTFSRDLTLDTTETLGLEAVMRIFMPAVLLRILRVNQGNQVRLKKR
jgi:hypothetical protein